MRLFVDSYLLSKVVGMKGVERTRGLLQLCIDAGHTLVCTEASALDNQVFRENLAWLEEHLKARNVIIEVYQGEPNSVKSGIIAMIHKKFLWSSYNGNLVTDWPEDFEALAKIMPDGDKLFNVYELVLKYALPNNAWEKGEWVSVNFFEESQLQELGLTNADLKNRSKVLAAMRAKNYPKEMHVDYIRATLAGLSSQHQCDDIALVELI